MLYEMDDCDAAEAEDFMCDQVIFTTTTTTTSDLELQSTNASVRIVSTTKLRLAIELLANALLPTVANVYYACVRNQRTVVASVRKILVPTVLAALANYLSQSLSSVQRRISMPRLEAADPSAPSSSSSSSAIELDAADDAEKSVECIVLNDPVEIKADIIFVHGLHGALHKTWRQGDWRHERHKINRQALTKAPSIGTVRNKNGLKRAAIKAQDSYVVLNKICKNAFGQSIDNSVFDEECVSGMEHPTTACSSCNASGSSAGTSNMVGSYSPCWPVWLDKDHPNARLIAVNYTTDPYLWRPIWVKKRNRTGMVERADEMIEHLRKLGVGDRPIIWVGHSKGGLYIKQVLINASAREADERGIFEQSKAILFYSVPHRGSIMADFSLPLFSKSIELTEVQKNCKFVLELHEKFLKLFEDDHFKPEVFSFIESSFTLMTFIYLKIVTIESADPGIGHICEVPLDHREICKPAGRDCFLYKELVRLVDDVLSGREAGATYAASALEAIQEALQDGAVA